MQQNKFSVSDNEFLNDCNHIIFYIENFFFICYYPTHNCPKNTLCVYVEDLHIKFSDFIYSKVCVFLAALIYQTE